MTSLFIGAVLVVFFSSIGSFLGCLAYSYITKRNYSGPETAEAIRPTVNHRQHSGPLHSQEF